MRCWPAPQECRSSFPSAADCGAAPGQGPHDTRVGRYLPLASFAARRSNNRPLSRTAHAVLPSAISVSTIPACLIAAIPASDWSTGRQSIRSVPAHNSVASNFSKQALAILAATDRASVTSSAWKSSPATSTWFLKNRRRYLFKVRSPLWASFVEAGRHGGKLPITDKLHWDCPPRFPYGQQLTATRARNSLYFFAPKYNALVLLARRRLGRNLSHDSSRAH
jgi:hypothetical protein